MSLSQSLSRRCHLADRNGTSVLFGRRFSDTRTRVRRNGSEQRLSDARELSRHSFVRSSSPSSLPSHVSICSRSSLEHRLFRDDTASLNSVSLSLNTTKDNVLDVSLTSNPTVDEKSAVESTMWVFTAYFASFLSWANFLLIVIDFYRHPRSFIRDM